MNLRNFYSRCRSSVQRARPTAGMLQVYHESWQKHPTKTTKTPFFRSSVTSPKTNISPKTGPFHLTCSFLGGACLGLSGHKWIRFGQFLVLYMQLNSSMFQICLLGLMCMYLYNIQICSQNDVCTSILVLHVSYFEILDSFISLRI